MKDMRYKLGALLLTVAVTINSVPVFATVTADTVSVNALSEASVSGTDESEKSTTAFYYEEYFEENGVKVILSADEDVVPDGAYADVELLGEEAIAKVTHALQSGVDESLQKKIEKARKNPTLSVYDMYYNLHADLEKTYAFDFNIYYTDTNGKTQIFEPGDRQTIKVSFVIPGMKQAVDDRMQEVDLHHLKEVFAGTDPGSILAETDLVDAERGNKEQGKNTEVTEYVTAEAESEILTEDLSYAGDSLSFEAEHFSVYAITIAQLGATADPAMVTAQQKAWKLIEDYADPAYFMKDPYEDEMTAAQMAELRTAAQKITAGLTTSYKKMEAITEYVCENTYYDDEWVNSESKDINKVNINPYAVYKNKTCVCGGFASLVCSLCIQSNIPCMIMVGEGHAYNIAYDREQDKWIFIDATWSSGNVYYGPDNWKYGGYNAFCFDRTPESIAEMSNHELYEIDGLLSDNAYYQMDWDESTAWTAMKWNIELMGAPKGVSTIVAKEKLGDFMVSAIDKNSFHENSPISNIDLSRTQITSIEPWTFDNNTALKIIRFPNTLEVIGKYAFCNCTSLQSIELKNTSVKSIGECAFYKCSQAKKLTLPTTFSAVEKNAFAFCKKIKNVDLSQTNLKTLTTNTFYACEGLKKVILPHKLNKMECESLGFCYALKSITIPPSVKKIDDKAINASSMTIYGAKKSQAQKFANKKNYTFKVKAPAKKIAINKKKATLLKGEKLNLYAKLTPVDSIDKIKWTSSNKKVAKVNANGVVTAKKKGKATITAKTAGGKTVTCKITVK